MPKLPKYETAEDRVVRIAERWLFICPGCGDNHAVTDSWTFNGDRVRPTFSPSILVTGPARFPTDDEVARITAGEKITLPQRRCHSFVREGRIQFLHDCTHALTGQTVELPPCPYAQDEGATDEEAEV